MVTVGPSSQGASPRFSHDPVVLHRAVMEKGHRIHPATLVPGTMVSVGLQPVREEGYCAFNGISVCCVFIFQVILGISVGLNCSIDFI